MATKLSYRTERFVVVNSLPLRLSFEPDAIRQHFDNCDRVQLLTDKQLAAIGEQALTNDDLYKTFNAVLRAVIVERCGFDPDDDAMDAK